MKTYNISKSDLNLSRLAYGTMHLGGEWNNNAIEKKEIILAEELILLAVEKGINVIDLADIYTFGKSDEVLGNVLRNNANLREKIVIQQKVGIILGNDSNFNPPNRYDFSYNHLLQSIERSLKKLGIEYFDILALHRPDPLVQYEEIAKLFSHLHRSGMVKHFGVSNHNAAQIQLLQKYIDQPIILNQVELSLHHHHLISNGILFNNFTSNHNSHSTLEYCRLNEILIQAWSPLAGGRLFSSNNQDMQWLDFQNLLSSLATKYQVRQEAIAISWLLKHPMGIQPIVGTMNKTRLRSIVDADDIELTNEEWYELLEKVRQKPVP